MISDPLRDVYVFLELTRSAGLRSELRSYSDDCVIAVVSVPGERWELEFFRDGRRTFERFSSNGVETPTPDDVLRLVGDYGETAG